MLKVDAMALYDYSARSDKELSFKKGDTLQVIEKTPDHNWWDGFHQGKRGFIPVAYIEILELGSDPPAALTVPVPTPPERKSSMPASDSSESLTSPRKTCSNPPSEAVIMEKAETVPALEDRVQIKTPELTVQSPSETEPAAPLGTGGPTPINVPTPSVPVPTPTVPVSVPTPSTPEPVPEPAPSVESTKEPEQHTSVRSLSKQFQEPQKVLVEPHSHRRQRSTDISPQPKGDEEVPPRSSSTGNKVGKMASKFEGKVNSPTAPLVSPKPKILRPHAPHPPVSSPSHTETHHPPPPTFPLMSHPQAGAAGISPLQRIAHQGQQKPVPAEKKGKEKEKKEDKGKVKRERSVKGAKPPPPAKPGFVTGNKDFNAELQARLARKQEPK